MKFPTSFKFKTEKPTGRYRSFYKSEHKILLNGNQVGSIDDGDGYSIRLMVIKEDVNEDGNPNCEWKWIKLKKQSDTLDDAKEFVNANFQTIISKYKLKELK